MKRYIAKLAIVTLLIFVCNTAFAQGKKVSAKAPVKTEQKATTVKKDSAIADTMVKDSAADDVLDAFDEPSTDVADEVESESFHKSLKTKFIEGNAGFMSLVAIALVIGLAFCIERIIYLSLSEINAKKFMRDLDEKIMNGDIEGAKTQCRETRGPVASICYQGLERINESIDNVERSVASYGSVQSANLEKGCSWITLFIAMAPCL